MIHAIVATLTLISVCSFAAAQATNNSAATSEALAQANRPFTTPEMMRPTIDEKVFTFTDVGAKIPNYTPGRQWGAQGGVSAIHLLGALATFGPPNANASASLVVRCVFEDGSKEDHPLINGKHLATYREKVDVPESKFAIDADGKQIRYLKLSLNSQKPLKSLEFVKGEDFSMPLIFAVTVESSDKAAH